VAGAAVLARWLAGAPPFAGPGTDTIHGTVTPSSEVSSVFGSEATASSYAGCAGASPAPGAQVTVTSPSGEVIGTATLGTWRHDHADLGGTTVYACDMPFTVTNVPAEARYGYQLAGVPGTTWRTGNSVSLTVTSTG
jgi:hypothetical protein